MRPSFSDADFEFAFMGEARAKDGQRTAETGHPLGVNAPLRVLPAPVSLFPSVAVLLGVLHPDRSSRAVGEGCTCGKFTRSCQDGSLGVSAWKDPRLGSIRLSLHS